MTIFLYNFFIRNWQRKGISSILALIIWFVVDHSLITSKTISHIPVRVINIPSGKTVIGLQNNGMLSKRITLTFTGNKTILDDLTSNDLEVIIDASDKKDEWMVSISKKNLASLNPAIDLSKGIDRVSQPSLSIRLINLVTEKIPILITKPMGEPPRDYQFLDIWPHRLFITLTGPEDLIKRIKTREHKLTFNLNDISKGELDIISASDKNGNGDVVSFFVPDVWKQLSFPLISDNPIEIDDPQAKFLRIDFVRCNLMAIQNPIPLALFFPRDLSATINPTAYSITANELIQIHHHTPMITIPLYAKGVSRLFIEIVQDMLEIEIIPTSIHEQGSFEWSIQFINPRMLENLYVAKLIADVSDQELRNLQPNFREEYLRNRFRSYMNQFQLFKADETKLELDIELQDNGIIIKEGS